MQKWILLSSVVIFSQLLLTSWCLAEPGCLQLSLGKEPHGAEYLIIFRVRNSGEDALFVPKEELPWQAGNAIFSARLVPQSRPEQELERVDPPRADEGMVALLPRDVMTRKVDLARQYRQAEQWLQVDDLLYFWKYKPAADCAEQSGMLLLEKRLSDKRPAGSRAVEGESGKN